ncbi:FKBP-type peptidyl-prolyl cis-trans isomerase [Hymenobacter persicinus]|nr:FKBP-type peptidyl-prolyl cis-trans isomerase [Hymenobacter persicinus]
MKKRVFSPARRFLLVAVLGAGSLLSACKKDYVKIDDKLINKYLTDNQITNAQRQESGLYYVPYTTDSVAVQAKAGRTVSVLYTGKLLNGTIFDASARHGNVPISFVLGQGRVIKGWDEGIALMHKGDKGLLLIPSALAYGEAGSPPSIPKNAPLQFEVQLVDVR